MIFEYCSKCGEKLEKREIGDEGLVPFCMPCNKLFFNLSYPCVICLIIDENNHVLLAKDARTDRYGGIAGFINEDETAENAAVREVKEEIGLAVIDLRYFKSYCREKSDRLMLGFICKVKNANLNISKELKSAEWFSLEEAKNNLRESSVILEFLNDYTTVTNNH